jgi:peptidoglycan/LPS O-acetylase OafA/YrhL
VHKIHYRPEIDGLRAIAVVIVIIYHTNLNIFGHKLFAGGFIGVDIFFVISGYLISSIILKEFKMTGSFSFKYFYERRIRRIIPLFIIVLLTSLPFAWIYLLPSYLEDFSKSILYSIGFISNFYFHYSGQIYGAENGIFKPLLHTWSLSVEEQYYLIFPFIFLITLKYFRKYLIYYLIIGFFLSLVLADWGSRYAPSFNFYFLLTRGWELLAGSILAYFENKYGHRSKFKVLNLVLPTVGLFLVSHYVIFFNNKIPHPSFYTLSPIIGVCLIIWFSNKNEIVSKILSTKLFVGIGLISYSLYLWHYPIFSFYRIFKSTEVSLLNYLFLGAVLLILSILSFFFIEKPARSNVNPFSKVLKILISLILIIFIFNFLVILNKGFPERKHFLDVLKNTSKNLNFRNISQNGLRCHNRLGDNNFCIFNELPNNSGDVILLGDSLTDALLGNLVQQISNTKYRLINMSYSANLYLPDYVSFNKETKKIITNETWHEFRKDFIQNRTNKNTIIIFYGDYNHYFEKKLGQSKDYIKEYESPILYAERNNIYLDYQQRSVKLKEKISETLIELSKNNKILLLYPSPTASVNVLKHIHKNKKKIINDNNFYLNDKINYSKKFYEEYNSEIINLFDKIISNNIYRVKLDKIFCPQDKCIFYDNKNVYIFDYNHPSHEGSKKINKLIIEEIKKIDLELKNKF